MTAPMVQCALEGISRAHVAAGTPRRARLPVSFCMLLTGEALILSSGPEGKVLCLCLCLRYFLLARSDEMFATDSGAVHRVHCLTRGDVAFNDDVTQLEYLRWRQADRVEMCAFMVIRVIRNQLEAYACGRGTRFAVRSRHLGSTVVLLPLCWG